MADGSFRPAFDWKAPDYLSVFHERMRMLTKLRADPQLLASLKVYYGEHDNGPIDFINDFGVTVDPRNLASGKPVRMPFILFPRQREFLVWLLARWKNGESGIVVKSRDVGASWLAMALACTLCLFRKNMMVGVGSAKQDKLDRTGDPDTLFWKAKTFIKELPIDFRAGWDEARDALFLRLLFPATSSSITGEAGTNIGRGGRKAFYIIDESAHLEQPQLVDASLASNTDCRIDISSVNGSACEGVRSRVKAHIVHMLTLSSVGNRDIEDGKREGDELFASQLSAGLLIEPNISRSLCPSSHFLELLGMDRASL